MKRLTTLFPISILTAFALTFSSPALGDQKGAQLLAANGASQVRSETGAAAKAAMTCPVVSKSAADLTARGGQRPLAMVNIASCDSCQTKQTSTGVGKLATHKMEHSCKQATSCCSGK
jgi:hypothetical protein